MPPSFKEDYIIKLFLWTDYEDIPLKSLIPFTDAKINTSEELILKQWEKHFQGGGLSSCKPYAITIDPKKKKKILWVEGSTKNF